MKYVILIQINPHMREFWQSLSDEERAAGYAMHGEIAAGLAASGELVLTEALGEPRETVRVTNRDGAVLTTDGPFAEVKEHLAGFYLVDCASRERAIEIAASLPESQFGGVEVRPVLQL